MTEKKNRIFPEIGLQINTTGPGPGSEGTQGTPTPWRLCHRAVCTKPVHLLPLLQRYRCLSDAATPAQLALSSTGSRDCISWGCGLRGADLGGQHVQRLLLYHRAGHITTHRSSLSCLRVLRNTSVHTDAGEGGEPRRFGTWPVLHGTEFTLLFPRSRDSVCYIGLLFPPHLCSHSTVPMPV